LLQTDGVHGACFAGIAMCLKESMQGCGVCSDLGRFRAYGTRVAGGEAEVAGEVAELPAGVTTEVKVARLERDEQAGVAELGLRLAEAKQLTAALQAELVRRRRAPNPVGFITPPMRLLHRRLRGGNLDSDDEFCVRGITIAKERVMPTKAKRVWR
jgi:hypothetical protein